MSTNRYKSYEPLFSNWHITSTLGNGSYGTVYEITRQDFGVTYKSALKAITIPQNPGELESVYAENTGEASVTAYFRKKVEGVVGEIVLMSKLKGNSNIVSYEDHTVIQHAEGIGWDILIRMELLTPLMKHIHNITITQNEVIKIGIHICKALELCQMQNIIHRDIKPENIFIAGSGEYKLGDFGISRMIERTTGVLSQRGTFAYIAPEVLSGKPYGASVDIYSLGIVMYWMLNKYRTPFLPSHPTQISPNDREVAFQKRISGAVIPPPSMADAHLANIVLKMCAYDLNMRYASVTHVRADLEALYTANEAQVMAYRRNAEANMPHAYERSISKTVPLHSIFKTSDTESTPPQPGINMTDPIVHIPYDMTTPMPHNPHAHHENQYSTPQQQLGHNGHPPTQPTGPHAYLPPKPKPKGWPTWVKLGMTLITIGLIAFGVLYLLNNTDLLPTTQPVGILNGPQDETPAISNIVRSGTVVTHIIIRGEHHSTTLAELHINDLYLSNEEIAPLRYMTNLTTLNISSSQLSDLTPLTYLTTLNYLHLGNNQISDLTPLRNLTALTRLDLYNNHITDISTLSALTNLTMLDLRGNHIASLTPLAELTNTEGIWIGPYAMPNGDIFIGQWHNNNPNGHGNITRPNGDWFEGILQGGIWRYGRGRHTWPDGSSFYGHWMENQYGVVRYGTHTFADGTTQSGWFDGYIG